MTELTPARAHRLRVRHVTGYRYSAPVNSSYNEARIVPLTTPRQTALEARVEVSPSVPLRRYWDYWGTLVHAFDVHQPHDQLEVVGSSTVETVPAPAPPLDIIGYDELAGPRVADRFVEHLLPTSSTPAAPELVEIGRDLAAKSPPVDLVHAVGAFVRDRMTYRAGATGVHTDAQEAFRAGEGVCQDFAHVAIVLLRAAGVPARYVSGYLHPRREAAIGESVAGESHAWIEAWLGDWWGYDPTNDLGIGTQHVLVARGRDYADVPPLSGLFDGRATSTLGVTVEVTRLA